MSLPAGVTTCNVIFNTPLSFAGGTGTATLTVRPTQTIIWAATGQPLGAFSDTVTTSAQPGSMALPVVDQPGFVDSAGNTVTNWAYTADVLWTVGTQNLSTHKSFQLLTGQTSVTFDLIPDGNTTIAVTAPTATVTSVNGATGPITLDSASVGLSNVDNTSDANKPLSTAATNALALKQDAASLDTTNAGLVNDSASATAAALNATYAPLGPGLPVAPTTQGASTAIQNLLSEVAQASWDPSQAPGVVAYWNADDVAGGSGASVASWTDRVSGIALTQGVTSAQPTIALNSGGTRHQGIRFTAASSQYMSAPIGAVPDAGPLWVWSITRLVTEPAVQTLLEASSAGVHTLGWSLNYHAANPHFTAIGLFDQSLSGGDLTGQVTYRYWGCDPIYAQNLSTSKFNQPNVQAVSKTTNVNPGSASITIGGAISYSNTWLDGEVLAIVVGRGPAPSVSTQTRMARWVGKNYGIVCGNQYNAPAPTVVQGTTHTGAASSTCVELGVTFNPRKTFGHKFWLAFSPYDGGVSDENPCVNYSDDGNTWFAGSIVNPLAPYPGGGSAGNNSDASIFDNTSRDGKMYVYYTRENATTGNGVYAFSSSDGITWTGLGQVASTASNSGESPVVCYDPVSQQYWLYSMTVATPYPLFRQTSASPVGPWSAPQPITYKLTNGQTIHHMAAPIMIGSRWVMTASDNTVNAQNLWLMSSSDGINFVCGISPIVMAGNTTWDKSLYRPAVVDAQDGINLYLWYTQDTLSTSSLSQMVTVPQSLIPQ